MLQIMRRIRWSPYMVGALVGGLLTFLFSIGRTLGVSSGVTRIAALLEGGIARSHVEATPYFAKLLSDHIIFDWKVLFVLGMLVGAFFSSRMSGDSQEKITIWQKAFGDNKIRRYVAAFLGGILLILGARIAGGCTSGHAITGGAQLSVSSWVFMMTLFAAAIPTSYLLYKRKGV